MPNRKLFGSFVYLLWVALLICAFSPTIFPSSLPLRRILCWVAPLLLALDVDAGNRIWVYIAKAIVWIPLQGCALVLLMTTHGFEHSPPKSLKMPIYSSIIILFFASCTLTVIGHQIRHNIFAGNVSTATHGQSLRLIDNTVSENPYANYKKRQLRTPLTPKHVIDAWKNKEEGIRMTTKEVSDFFLYSCFATQFVMARTFKSTENRVFVYSTVAHYRATIFCFAIFMAGVVHVFESLFEQQVERDVVQSILLWLTLPTITLPALLKIKFGKQMHMHRMLRGLLPANTDKQMWQRLGVGPKELYCALTNAIEAENILKQKVGLINNVGTGTVHITDIRKARFFAKASLLEVGDNFIRISDGKRFPGYHPREHGSFSAVNESSRLFSDTVTEPMERNDAAGSAITSEIASLENDESSSNAESASQTKGTAEACSIDLGDELTCSLQKSNPASEDQGCWQTFGGVIGAPAPEWIIGNYENRPFLCRCWLRLREKRYYRGDPKTDDERDARLQYLDGLLYNEIITPAERDTLAKEYEQQS